jgi:hypothetical protein
VTKSSLITMIRNHMERWGWKSSKSQEEEEADESFASELNASSVVLSRSEIQALNPQLLLSTIDRVQIYDGDSSTAMSPSGSEENKTAFAAQAWLNNGGTANDKENGCSPVSAEVAPSPHSRNLSTPLSLHSRRNSIEGIKVCTTPLSMSSPLGEVDQNSPGKGSNTRLGSTKSVTSLAGNRFMEDGKKPFQMHILEVTSSSDCASGLSSGRSQASSVLSSNFQEAAPQAKKDVSVNAWNNPSSKLRQIFRSAARPGRDSVASEVKKEPLTKSAGADEDPFEWAYEVWRRKGIMQGEKKSSSRVIRRYSVYDDAMDKKLENRRTERREEAITCRHSLPATTAKTKDDDKNFANILKQWKTISNNNPCSHFLSPPEQSVPAQQETQTQTSSSSGSEPRPETSQERMAMKVVGLAPQNPAASIPILQPRDASTSPVRRAPQSQAWKLKMGREQRLNRASMPTASTDRKFRRIKSPPKSRRDYKSVVQDFLRDVDDETKRDGVESAPRSRSQNGPSPKPPIAPIAVESPLMPLSVAAPANNGAFNLYQRSQSLPRHRHQPSDSSMSAIRSHLKRENELMRVALASLSPSTVSIKGTPIRTTKDIAGHTNERILVKDLDIIDNDSEKRNDCEDITRSIPLEVRIATTEKASTESDLFSPYTQRVMRNLEKVYNVKDEVTTPRGGAYSERPWQHDRFIRRIESLTDEGSTAVCQCSCSNSVFSGNDDMIEFFLPLMGTACSCGEKQPGLAKPEEPTSLVNILRPWQVAFLGGFGIYRGEELVKANHRSGAALAKALRQYRKREGMTPFRSESCTTALQIWSKTCKAFVRSIRNQIKAAKRGSTESPPERGRSTRLRLPNTLYILSSFLDTMPNDSVPLASTTASISTGSRSSFGISTTTPIGDAGISGNVVDNEV